MRRAWLVIAAAAAVVTIAGACANSSIPPGGPPDFRAPVLVRVSPENGDTSVTPKVFALQFDEVISETASGAPDLAGLVFISPKSGDVRVDWKRSRLEIRPRDGFRDSAVYTIVLRPGVQDLSSNKIDTTTTFVFSTGGPIPETWVTGVVFDWPGGRGARSALVEAMSAVDTTTSYVTIADSVGRFALRYVPPGQYLVRGFIDRNNNRSLERTELWDTVSIPLRDSAAVELYSFIHDSMPARITDIAVLDSGKLLRLTFDKPLSLDQLYTPPQFSLRTLPDSTPLAQRVTTVRTRAQQLSIDSTTRKARADSVAAAAAAKDTIPVDSATIARRDSVARVARLDSIARADRTVREQRRLLALRGERAPARVDTTPPPKMQRAVPTIELLIVLDTPVPSDARLIVEAKDLITLSGVTGTARRPIRTPKRDSTPPDSAPPPAQRAGRIR